MASSIIPWSESQQSKTRLLVRYYVVSGDKADIVSQDSNGNIIGAEIEIHVEGSQIVRVLQAIKYHYMLALMEERRCFETRAFLIARSISKAIIDLCNKYKVECFVVKNDGEAEKKT